MLYQSLNYMNQDLLLTKEEQMIRKTVRHFVNQEVLPLMQASHRQETFPTSLISRFGKLQLLGSTLPAKYGCAELKDIAYGLIMQELERGDSGIRSFCSVQGALVMWPIFQYGSEEQKKKFLPQLAKGKLIGCFALTEPDAGSDPGAIKTQAKRVKGGYALNGNKMWITNGCLSDIAIVWAKHNQEIQAFLVEKKFKGFSSKTMKGKFSLRISVTSELHFKDCFVPDTHVLPKAKGLKSALNCLTQARYGIGWGVIGSANQCYHTALHYVNTRTAFNKKLSQFQLVQAKLVSMMQEITKAQLLAWQAGQLKQKNQLTHAQVSLLKMNNCRMALNTARLARDLLGANGIIDEYPVIRHLLNMETINTYEGTEDIHRLNIGKSLTNYSAIR